MISSSIFKSLTLLLVILSVTELVTSNHPFTVINRCSQTIWVGTFGDDDIPAGGSFKLDPNGQRSFTAIQGWTSGRIWGKTGCDDNGKNCETGEAPEGGRTTLQAVTLAEFGLDKWMGMDFYDISLVDGFNVPITIQPTGTVNEPNCRLQGCNFNYGVCPEQFKEYGRNGQVIACKSACSATWDPQYCCPAPQVPESECHPSEYSEIFKRECPDAYTWAYDYKDSDRNCRGNPVSGYEVTFCG